MSGSLGKNVTVAAGHLEDTAGYPARAEEGARENEWWLTISPKRSLLSFSLPSTPFFHVGCIQWKNSERLPKTSENLVSVSLLQICPLFDWPEKVHLLGMVHCLVLFRQISFPEKLYFISLCFVQFSKDGLKGRVVISFFMSLSVKDEFDC